MSSTFVLGAEVGTSTEPRYFYGLRKEDDGTLYITRVDLNSTDSSDSVVLFPELPPIEFEDITIPGDDYFDGRDPTTKEVVYDRNQVKYEQWKWDTRLISYYLNKDGELVVSIGEDRMIPESGSDLPIGNSIAPFIWNVRGRISDIDIRESLRYNGWNGMQEVIINIPENASITSSVQDRAAMTISGVYPNGITINNAGNIVGAIAYVKPDGTYVNPGNAMNVTTDCTIINDGTISGGSSVAAAIEDGYGINGIDYVTLTNNGTINSTI